MVISLGWSNNNNDPLKINFPGAAAANRVGPTLIFTLFGRLIYLTGLGRKHAVRVPPTATVAKLNGNNNETTSHTESN